MTDYYKKIRFHLSIWTLEGPDDSDSAIYLDVSSFSTEAVEGVSPGRDIVLGLDLGTRIAM